MELKNRLATICAEKNISTKELAAIIEAPAQYLYDIRHERIKTISAERAARIAAAFPEYSIEWIISGERVKSPAAVQAAADGGELVERVANLESEVTELRTIVEQIANKYRIKVPNSRKRGRPRKE